MLNIAHRGASGHVMENSFAAFELAIQQGADMIELDVRPTKDGTIVVFHDDTLERLAEDERHIIEMSDAEVAKVRLAGDHPIPTLEKTLIEFAHRTILCIELKEQGMVEDIITMLDRLKPDLSQLWFISFFHEEVATLKARLPDLNIAPIIVGLPIDKAEFGAEMNAQAIHPNIHFLDQAFVDDAHERGLRVHIWTADEEEDIEKAIALGVDGITSNFPDRIVPYCKDSAKTR